MNNRSLSQRARSKAVRLAQLAVAREMARAMRRRGLVRKLGKMMEARK